MRREVVTCDVCGINKDDLQKHWSTDIRKMVLPFRGFPNIQKDIVIGDVCTNCAKAIFESINIVINKKINKAIGGKNDN